MKEDVKTVLIMYLFVLTLRKKTSGRSRPNVPTYRYFLNLPRRKVMIYFCQKGKKMGGHRARFRDHEVHFEKLALF